VAPGGRREEAGGHQANLQMMGVEVAHVLMAHVLARALAPRQ
jgi:hypothetical protein